MPERDRQARKVLKLRHPAIRPVWNAWSQRYSVVPCHKAGASQSYRGVPNWGIDGRCSRHAGPQGGRLDVLGPLDYGGIFRGHRQRRDPRERAGRSDLAFADAGRDFRNCRIVEVARIIRERKLNSRTWLYGLKAVLGEYPTSRVASAKMNDITGFEGVALSPLFRVSVPT